MTTHELPRPSFSSGSAPDGSTASERLERSRDIPNAVLSLYAVLCLEDSKRWFPGHTNRSLNHHTLSLCGEVGEIANLIKKVDRGDLDIVDAMDEHLMSRKGKDTLQGEIADVFIYLMNLVGLLNIDLAAEFNKKRDVNEARWGNK